MNKKVIAAGMAMVLASMGLTACGDSGSKEAKDSSDETYTVTMAFILEIRRKIQIASRRKSMRL